jgi:hypothetical protein
MNMISLLDLLNFTEKFPEKKRKKGGRYFGRSKAYSIDHDLVETPRVAVEALLSVEKFQGNILEPCAGKGAISNILEEYGYEVVSRDLIDRGIKKIETGKSYFQSNEIFDNVVTNPPYKFANQFCYHAIQHSRYKVAFLLRVNFLETVSRREWLFDNKDLPTCFERLYVFSERVPFGEAQMVLYCWFLWNKNFQGTPTIHWL